MICIGITMLKRGFSGGIAFKLSSMKDMFYVPMQEFMGLSNTQIGAALSVYQTWSFWGGDLIYGMKQNW